MRCRLLPPGGSPILVLTIIAVAAFAFVRHRFKSRMGWWQLAEDMADGGRRSCAFDKHLIQRSQLQCPVQSGRDDQCIERGDGGGHADDAGFDEGQAARRLRERGRNVRRVGGGRGAAPRRVPRVGQRRARERESPIVCVPCLKKVWEGKDTADVPMGLFNPQPNFRMVIEECNYEDVQDISMSQITYNKEHHLISASSRNQIIGTVSDDLVDQVGDFPYARINGIVRVQPVPARTFAKDTRRLLSIDIISVEELYLED